MVGALGHTAHLRASLWALLVSKAFELSPHYRRVCRRGFQTWLNGDQQPSNAAGDPTERGVGQPTCRPTHRSDFGKPSPIASRRTASWYGANTTPQSASKRVGFLGGGRKSQIGLFLARSHFTPRSRGRRRAAVFAAWMCSRQRAGRAARSLRGAFGVARGALGRALDQAGAVGVGRRPTEADA